MRKQVTAWRILAPTLLVLVVLSQASGQEKTFFIDGKETVRSSFPDTLAFKAFLDEILISRMRQGYFFARVDSITHSAVWISGGSKSKLLIDSVYGFNQSPVPLDGDPFRYIDTELRRLGNAGYPFASFRFTKPQVLDSVNLGASIILDKGPFIRWDSLVLPTKINTHRRYLLQTLGIKMGEPFSEEVYGEVETRIRRIPFISARTPPDISFAGGKATLYLDLEEQSFNTFEGVLGILSNTESAGGLLLTGYLDLHLGNLFYSGKTLDFDWQRFGEQSQSLNLAVGYPYPADSRLLTEFGFSLLRQDTSFLNQSLSILVGSYLGSATRFQGGYTRVTGQLIAPDLENLSRNLADYTQDNYSVSIDYNQSTTPFQFEDGLKGVTTFRIGRKRVSKNPALPDTFYDSLSPRSNVYGFVVQAKAQKILTKFGALSWTVSSGGFWNESPLVSELYRLGGLSTVRGFNENEFFARQYAWSQLEWRQYFEQTSYAMIFYDQLVYKGLANNQAPFGFGLGLVLNTNGGLLNFAIGLGGTPRQPPNPSTLKIHFGYQALF